MTYARVPLDQSPVLRNFRAYKRRQPCALLVAVVRALADMDERVRLPDGSYGWRERSEQGEKAMSDDDVGQICATAIILMILYWVFFK